MEISKTTIYIAFQILMLLDVLQICQGKRDAKEKCPTCRDIVDAFLKGVEKTENANYGGGNTEWEERALGSYAKSETRLVEIMEGLCSESSSECHAMVEEHEETLEDWWFKVQSKELDLKTWFCVDRVKVCCPNGTYGSDCGDCPGGKDNVCGGHGQCEGDGSRQGSGKCECDFGYEGDTCDECSDDHFEEKDEDSKLKCTACHEACDGCTGSSSSDCEKCKEGWHLSDDGECTDKDECTEEGKCESGQYCANTPGSFTCENCDSACAACTGGGAKNCTECSSGYENTDDGCTDVNECNEADKCEVGKYCVNTAGSFKCRDCHESCEGGCSGAGAKGCQACKTGYTMNDEEGCKDNDECVESSSLCENGKYCVNIPASFKCEACHAACVTCIGEGRQGCTKCNTGYVMGSNGCEDLDECTVEPNKVCVDENEKCKNSIGSYKCVCRSGFTRQGGKCTKKKGKKAQKTTAKTEEELLAEELEKGNYFSEAQMKIGSLLYAVFFGCLFLAVKKKQIWALAALTLLYACVLWYLRKPFSP